MSTKAELVIHPVRMRILSALAARPMNTRQLAEALPDVPQATLYRQVRTLAEAGAIRPVEQRTINGIVESTYAAVSGAGRFDRAEFAAILPEDHGRYFAVFLGIQMGDATAYFRQPEYDTTREGMTYFRASLALTDEEAQALRLELLDVVKRHARPPGPGRRLQNVAISSIPEPRPETRA